MITNTITEEEVQQMQKRQIQNVNSKELSRFMFAPVIVQKNTTRQNINHGYAGMFAHVH